MILYRSPHDLPLLLCLLQVAHLTVQFVSGSMNMLADTESPRIKCNDCPRQQYCDIRFLCKVSDERVPIFRFSDGDKDSDSETMEEANQPAEGTRIRSKKASKDVPIALTVTNDVKDQSTAMAVGGVAIASTGLVAAVMPYAAIESNYFDDKQHGSEQKYNVL